MNSENRVKTLANKNRFKRKLSLDEMIEEFNKNQSSTKKKANKRKNRK
jgi:hypothetical protein